LDAELFNEGLHEIRLIVEYFPSTNEICGMSSLYSYIIVSGTADM